MEAQPARVHFLGFAPFFPRATRRLPYRMVLPCLCPPVGDWIHPL